MQKKKHNLPSFCYVLISNRRLQLLISTVCFCVFLFQPTSQVQSFLFFFFFVDMRRIFIKQAVFFAVCDPENIFLQLNVSCFHNLSLCGFAFLDNALPDVCLLLRFTRETLRDGGYISLILMKVIKA